MELTKEAPLQLQSIDPHAARRWPKFLRKVGLKMTKNGWNDPHRALIVVNFGIPSLLQRLPHATTEVERARVWWRESVACSAGSSIPDLSNKNRYLLNPFIVEGPKFRNERLEKLHAVKDAPAPQMPRLEIVASPEPESRKSSARGHYFLRCRICRKRFRASRRDAKTCSAVCRSRLRNLRKKSKRLAAAA